MIIEIDPTRIIKETRLEKHVFTLSRCELEFIVKHKALTADEKLLWLLLASMSTEEEDLSCTINYEKLALKTEIPCDHLIQNLQQLEAMGFLKRHCDAEGDRCSISLPNAGLLYLRLSSKKETPEWLKRIRVEEQKDVFMWW